MDLTVVSYLLYFAFTVPLTIWVARTLYRHGRVFLFDVFGGDERLATSVNQLLVIGFYLLNLGYVALFMASGSTVTTGRRLLEVLSAKVGGVAVVIGVVHLANVWVFNTFRRRAIGRARPVTPAAPVPPNAYAPMPAGPPLPPGAWMPPPPPPAR